MVQGWHGLVTADVPEATQAWSSIRHYIQTIIQNSHWRHRAQDA
jgi:hypothetical protein